MANTIENTFKKIGDTLETIFNGGTIKQDIISNSGGKPSPLEMIGMQARAYHLMRNEWKKDLWYTKPLVDAEYLVQTEFKIGPSKEDIEIQHQKEQETIKEKEQKKQAKQKKESDDEINNKKN